ncbi:hypothetical protein ASG43_08595 [Aureimonas sp. Leaf454]|uniref:hypothetical protein n=1 Tax=Aureimonas sp. Leaf454 TaxID=1736381 RepID=UPI0007012B64|nr:hypothetical protein [Aureimonas sp. Leaf454]KQT48889.1 hypothetical protein ASG43_08595 [Aureimonas sp. Leaf454]
MIRGHIDFVSRGRVEGWIFCEKLALTGHTVLAFVDDQCVGGGPISRFRQDLLEAGIGDGVVGFGFPVALEPWHDPRTLDVRLDGSTLQLKQADARLVPRDSVGEDRRRQGRDPAALAFMHERGWLSRAQFEALKTLGEFGVHVQALRLETRSRMHADLIEDVARTAGEQLELFLMQPIEIEIVEGAGPADLAAFRREMRAAFPFVPPIVGLWAKSRLHVQVAEGSHHDGTGGGRAVGGVEYGFGERHLLLLDLDAGHTFLEEARSGFTVFVPRRPAT